MSDWLSQVGNWVGDQVSAELDARRQAIYSPPPPATVGANNGVVTRDGQPQPRVDVESGTSSGMPAWVKNPLVVGGLAAGFGLLVYLAVRN